jgi:hypothetical protein
MAWLTIAPLSHKLFSLVQLDRPDKYRGWKSFPLRDEIEQPMHPVSKVNISMTWRTIHYFCPGSQTSPGVTSLIVFANIGFGFNDKTAQSPLILDPHQTHSQQLLGNQ